MDAKWKKCVHRDPAIDASMRHGGLCLDIGIWILYAQSELEQRLFEKESGENDYNNVKVKLDFWMMLWTATHDIKKNLVLTEVSALNIVKLRSYKIEWK